MLQNLHQPKACAQVMKKDYKDDKDIRPDWELNPDPVSLEASMLTNILIGIQKLLNLSVLSFENIL